MLYDFTYMKYLEQENSWRQKAESSRGWGEGCGCRQGELFNGHGVYAGNDEPVPKMRGGEGYTALWKYLMPLNCTPTNG